jgi:hypothetical protein
MHFLTSAVDVGELSASHPGRFTPRVRVAGAPCIGGWMVHSVGEDVVANEPPAPIGIGTLSRT